MSDVNLATKSDLASLFQELEDAAKHAKIENKENKIKTESQVKELDSFLTSVQEVVKVIDESPKESNDKNIQKKTEKKSVDTVRPNGVDTSSKDTQVNETTDTHKNVSSKKTRIVADIKETKSLSKEDENKLGAFAGLMSSFGAILDAPPEVKDTDALKLQIEDIYPKVITQEEENSKLEALQNLFSNLVEEPRIPRKKGQPAGSDKHSDLYTDENPVGTIKGLGFKDVETARASVKKIEGSDRTHAHKIQAAIAMEQRARVMGKKAEAAIYRAYIEKMKKKTKEMRKEDAHGFKCPPGYKFDRKLMACVPKKTRFKTVYAYPYFFGGTKSGDQSGQAQSGQNGNGNGNGNGNAQGGNGNGNGGNGNGGNAGGGNGGGNGG